MQSQDRRTCCTLEVYDQLDKIINKHRVGSTYSTTARFQCSGNSLIRSQPVHEIQPRSPASGLQQTEFNAHLAHQPASLLMTVARLVEWEINGRNFESVVFGATGCPHGELKFLNLLSRELDLLGKRLVECGLSGL